MRATFVSILPLAVVVMVSPVNIVAAILLLFTQRPIANASSYLAGFVVGVGGMLAALVALAEAVDLTGGSGPSRTASIIRIALGGYLVVAGLSKFRGRRARERPLPRPSGWPGSPHSRRRSPSRPACSLAR
jgi:hypothetical protein